MPGPIGSILAPARDAKRYASLPHACSLCGSCTDVCPVKIDLHHQLLTWRREIAVRGHLPWSKADGDEAGADGLEPPVAVSTFWKVEPMDAQVAAAVCDLQPVEFLGKAARAAGSAEAKLSGDVGGR